MAQVDDDLQYRMPEIPTLGNLGDNICPHHDSRLNPGLLLATLQVFTAGYPLEMLPETLKKNPCQLIDGWA